VADACITTEKIADGGWQEQRGWGRGRWSGWRIDDKDLADSE